MDVAPDPSFFGSPSFTSALFCGLDPCPLVVRLTPYFQYELAPIPTCLFLGTMMRKPNKALLVQSLLGKDYQLVEKIDIIATNVNVVDGGALLRKVLWKEGSTFKDVVDLYRWCVKLNYGQATIVFDRYGNNPSTKDHEQSRRSCRKCPSVRVENPIKVTINQHTFLPNDSNKTELIKLLTPKLISDGSTVKQSKDDTDTMIVSAALEGL